MKEIFADAGYWIAMLDRSDELHQRARAVTGQLASCRKVTTQMVLVEFLNFMGRSSEHKRKLACQMVERLESSLGARDARKECYYFLASRKVVHFNNLHEAGCVYLDSIGMTKDTHILEGLLPHRRQGMKRSVKLVSAGILAALVVSMAIVAGHLYSRVGVLETSMAVQVEVNDELIDKLGGIEEFLDYQYQINEEAIEFDKGTIRRFQSIEVRVGKIEEELGE